jgi:non-homologous end joining protein Ku
LSKQIEHYAEMQERAEALDNDVWEDRFAAQIAELKKQRKAAKCKETAGEAAERRIAELMALLKAAGKGAVTFFTMGSM